MYHFIDDSGAFSWHPPGISLFAAVLVPDRALEILLDRFVKWKRTVIGLSTRELKGQDLTENQLEAFSYKVFPPLDQDPCLTIIGTDTTLTSSELIQRCCLQVGEQFAQSAKLVLQHNPKNKRLAQQYTEAAGWVRRRSPENFLWVNTLEEAILQTVQHSTVYFVEEADDIEFENIEIIIDRSFISREQHITFWKEWLRNGLVNRSHRGKGFIVLDDWGRRNHPFLRKYGGEGLFQFNDLYQKHMRFDDSKAVLGLQIADICAHICYRFYRGEPKLQAYWNLRPRILGKHGTPMTQIQFTEASLYKDGVENHVSILDVGALKATAADRKRKSVDPRNPEKTRAE